MVMVEFLQSVTTLAILETLVAFLTKAQFEPIELIRLMMMAAVMKMRDHIMCSLTPNSAPAKEVVITKTYMTT